MKRIIVLTLFAGLVLHLGAQMVADFESPATTPVFSAEGATSVVDNPDMDGINTSAKVGYYNKIVGNWHYVSMEFPDSVDIGYNNTLTFKIRSSVAGMVFAKFWVGDNVLYEDWANEYGFKPSVNTWTECEVDITPAMGKKFTTLQIAACVYADEETNPEKGEADVYFDDVELSNPEVGDGSAKVIFTVSENVTTPGVSITFDASGSYDYDGEITDYSWDFGDGTTASGNSVSHSYSKDSTYKTILTLTDNDGKISSGGKHIFVIDEANKLSSLAFTEDEVYVNEKIEAVFQINDTYSNVYDPDEIKVDAEITFPDNKVTIVPCFYYIGANLENTSFVLEESFKTWMLRFVSEQSGIHSVKLILTDSEGEITSESYTVDVTNSATEGIIRNDSQNKQYFRHSSGEPFYPLGINLGWSGIKTYKKIINKLSVADANLIRYWHTPFAQQALEWTQTTFYDGLGKYSQQAAAMSDYLLDYCEERDMYMQLAIFQHGMFSENVNEMWAENPYNLANGGYVARAEEYFYNDDCKAQTKKLLRYIVARWGYSKNLFAWEFFNEVQFTGISNSQTTQWYPGVLQWHSEMSKYVAEIDPFNHIQTTSAADEQLLDLDTIAELDVLQYHLYSSDLLDAQAALDFYFREELQNKPIINGEYGTNNEAEVPFDMQRNAVWNGVMTQVPRFMWIWDHYTDPTWAAIFTMPAAYLKSEDFASEEMNDFEFSASYNSFELNTLGITNNKDFYGYIYHSGYASSIKDAVLKLSSIPNANYSVEYFLPEANATQVIDSIALIKLENKIILPEFSKGMAFKIKYLSDYTLPIAIAGKDTVVSPGNVIHLSGNLSYSNEADIQTYLWAIEVKPSGSALSINNSSNMSIDITPDVSGIYKVSLVVNDGIQSSVPDVITIIVSNPPVAITGNDTTVAFSGRKTNLTLDGSASYDADGDDITYNWTVISAPAESDKNIYNFDKALATLLIDAQGTYVVQLVVNDGISDSDPAVMTVNAGGLGVNESMSEFIQVYPNPSNGKLTISTMNNDKVEKVQVIDYSGKNCAVFNPAGLRTVSLDLESLLLSEGIIILRITTNKTTISKQVVLRRK